MLGFAIDLIQWLQGDQAEAQALRHERDRRIALKEDVAAAQVDSLVAVRQWWLAVVEETPSASATKAAAITGRQLERTRTLLAIALLVLGLIFGSGVAAAALRYDGSAPVNLVAAVGLLVLLPALLFLFTLLLLPGRLPLAGWLQDIVAALSPGQWASQWLNNRFRGVGFGWRSSAPRYLGDTERAIDLPGVGRLARWQLLLYSQLFAFGYALGALGMLVGLIAFSDMAFGWSTTLEVSAERVASWVQVLAMPWAALWPAAAPGLELVEASRFYRAAGVEADQAVQLGNWWPFLLMAVFTYSLLPRLLLLLFARARLRRAERSLLLGHPLVQKLLQRMTTPTAAHLQPPPEPLDPASATRRDLPSTATPIDLAPSTSCLVVIWNQSLADDDLRLWFPEAASTQQLALGSATPLAEEQALLAVQPKVDRVVIFTKAWEPPLLELQDLLLRLASLLTPGGTVQIVPVGIDGAAPAATDLEIWQQTISLVDDVRLAVWSPA